MTGTGDTSQDSARGNSPAWWRRHRGPIAAGAAGIAALLITVPIVINGSGPGSGSFDDSLTGPVAKATISDPLPDEPLVTEIPDNCAVPTEIVDRLVPDGEPATDGPADVAEDAARACDWQSGTRDLQLRVWAFGVHAPPRDSIWDTALAYTSRLPPRNFDGTEADGAAFSGLGDEAVYFNEKVDPAYGEYTTVQFRSVNLMVRISYSTDEQSTPDADADLPGAGADLPDDLTTELDTDTEWAGAMNTAIAVAESTGAEVADSLLPVAPTPDEPQFTEAPDLCAELFETSSHATIAEGEHREDDYATDPSFLGEDYDGRSCAWDGGGSDTDTADIDVDFGVYPTDGPTDGATAARRFDMRHHDASEPPEPEDGAKDEGNNGHYLNVALSDLGNEAYASHLFEAPEKHTSRITFRDRNLIVRVTRIAHDDTRSADEALNDTFAVATDAADISRALP